MDKIDQLEQLQASKNEGRGVSCVRTVIACLRRGDLNAAEACCMNEQDKINQYPDVEKLLREMCPKFNAWHEKMERLFGK